MQEFLDLYAWRRDAVEIDASFYRLFQAQTVATRRDAVRAGPKSTRLKDVRYSLSFIFGAHGGAGGQGRSGAVQTSAAARVVPKKPLVRDLLSEIALPKLERFQAKWVPGPGEPVRGPKRQQHKDF